MNCMILSHYIIEKTIILVESPINIYYFNKKLDRMQVCKTSKILRF